MTGRGGIRLDAAPSCMSDPRMPDAFRPFRSRFSGLVLVFPRLRTGLPLVQEGAAAVPSKSLRPVPRLKRKLVQQKSGDAIDLGGS
jgi:hypothetical protein